MTTNKLRNLITPPINKIKNNNNISNSQAISDPLNSSKQKEN